MDSQHQHNEDHTAVVVGHDPPVAEGSQVEERLLNSARARDVPYTFGHTDTHVRHLTAPGIGLIPTSAPLENPKSELDQGSGVEAEEPTTPHSSYSQQSPLSAATFPHRSSSPWSPENRQNASEGIMHADDPIHIDYSNMNPTSVASNMSLGQTPDPTQSSRGSSVTFSMQASTETIQEHPLATIGARELPDPHWPNPTVIGERHFGIRNQFEGNLSIRVPQRSNNQSTRGSSQAASVEDPASPETGDNSSVTSLSTYGSQSTGRSSQASSIRDPTSPTTVDTPPTLSCPTCARQFVGEYRKGNHARHIRIQHGGGNNSPKILQCVSNTCWKVFRRSDAMLKHVRKHHPELYVASPAARAVSQYSIKPEMSEGQKRTSKIGYIKKPSPFPTPAAGCDPKHSTHVGSPTPPDKVRAVLSDLGRQGDTSTDPESGCSIPQNLQDFIAFFGNALIEKGGARQWAEFAMSHLLYEEVESHVNESLKEYTISLALNPPRSWGSDCTKGAHQAQDPAQTQVLHDAVNLIRRYRPNISQHFCINTILKSVGTASIFTHPQKVIPNLSPIVEPVIITKSSSSTKNMDLEAYDEMTDNKKEEILFSNLENIRNFLISSDAFRQLALDIRRKLYHDERLQMERIRSVLLKTPQASLREAHFNVNWTVAEFLRGQYESELPGLGSVVVLTGSALYAQATTVAEYVKAIWPKSGPIIIELLDAALRKGRTTPLHMDKACDHLPLAINIRFNPSGELTFHVRGSDETLIIEIAQQIAWVGSALSASPYGDELAYATPLFSTTSHASTFEVKFEHKPLHATETACWLPLFCGAAIASGFPIPSRAEEVGLEIPPELLAGIAGVRHAVEYEGGMVMKGFSHMFVPVRKMNDCVQWHAIYSENTETRLSYHDALSRCKSRASTAEVCLDDINSCRAIVGWCSISTSRLGSDSINYENIDYSGAKDADSSIRCAGGSLGFQQFGMASLDFRFGAKDGRCHFQRSGPYQRIVSVAEKTPVVLYDTGEKRGWLVPAASVMLHMAQHRHQLEPFEVNGKRITLNTNVSFDSSVKKVLLENESLPLSDSKEYTFKDVILNTWSLLEFLIDQNVIRDRNASGASLRGPFREFLTGFEFKAVVEERSPLRQKQTPLSKTHGGWPQLVRDIDALVLLANGFEDIIVPADHGNSGLCRSWQRLPKEQDYLATSTKTLKELYDVAGCRLTRKYLTSTQLQWHQGESIIFDTCEDSSKACQCNRLQQILPTSAIGTIQPPRHIASQGAVIFGRSGSMWQDLRSKRHGQTFPKPLFYNQPNSPIPPVVIEQHPKDTLFSEADISCRNGSDTTAESTPSSLLTCTTLSSQDSLQETQELIMNTNLPENSKKRNHLTQKCSGLSYEDGEEHSAASSTHKRARSNEVRDPPSCSRVQYHHKSAVDAPKHKHSLSDYILQGDNGALDPGVGHSDGAPISVPVGESQDPVKDAKNRVLAIGDEATKKEVYEGTASTGQLLPRTMVTPVVDLANQLTHRRI